MDDIRIFTFGSGKHADQCTPGLCLCSEGTSDGTPMVCDYEAAGQLDNLTMGDISFDFNAVLEQVKIRMGWDEAKQEQFQPRYFWEEDRWIKN